MRTFTNNIPQAGQTIASTQDPILQNFQAINELINVNHVGFSNTDDYGKHNFTSFVAQVSDPVTVDQMALYSKLSTDTNGIELFKRYPNNGAVVQVTGFSGSGTGATNPGYGYLSATLMMKWGIATGISPSTSNVITFPTAGSIPAFTSAPLTVYFVPNVNYTCVQGSNYVSASTTTNFTLVTTTSFATSVYWMAIGAY